MTAADSTPHLLLHTAHGEERYPLMGKHSWTLGRHDRNDIHLPERSVSREHAQLECIQNRHFKLTDLGSRNGSTVNQQPVAAPIILQHGDRLRLGSVELTFAHSLISNAAAAPDPTYRSVLLIQGSVLQGKIWQEILLSQGLSVQWQAPCVDLQQWLHINQRNPAFPRVLLLDIQAYPGNIDAFCRWCQTHFPQLTVLLVNNAQRQISVAERQWAQSIGCRHFLPAFRTPKLLDNVAGIVVHLNLVLQAFDNQMLHQHKLFLALNTLEELMQHFSPSATAVPVRASQVPSTAQVAGLDEDMDITSISNVQRTALRS